MSRAPPGACPLLRGGGPAWQVRPRVGGKEACAHCGAWWCHGRPGSEPVLSACPRLEFPHLWGGQVKRPELPACGSGACGKHVVVGEAACLCPRALLGHCMSCVGLHHAFVPCERGPREDRVCLGVRVTRKGVPQHVLHCDRPGRRLGFGADTGGPRSFRFCPQVVLVVHWVASCPTQAGGGLQRGAGPSGRRGAWAPASSGSPGRRTPFSPGL